MATGRYRGVLVSLWMVSVFAGCDSDKPTAAAPTKAPAASPAAPAAAPAAPAAAPAAAAAAAAAIPGAPALPTAAAVAVAVAAPTPTPGSGGGDCASAMVGYEKFVDEYIDYMSRVSKGDTSGLAKAQPLMAKANEAAQKISAMLRLPRDAACMKRYTGINAKMSRAAAKMSGASSKELKQLDEANKAAAKGIDQMSCMQKCQKKSDPTAQASCVQGCL